MKARSLISITDFTKEEYLKIMQLAQDFESNPNQDLFIFDKYGRKYKRQIGTKEFFGTKCFLYLDKKDHEGPSFIGVSKLHKYDEFFDTITMPNGGNGFDIFNKEVGRTLSLDHAIKKIVKDFKEGNSTFELTKEQREEIWIDYYNRS